MQKPIRKQSPAIYKKNIMLQPSKIYPKNARFIHIQKSITKKNNYCNLPY